MMLIDKMIISHTHLKYNCIGNNFILYQRLSEGVLQQSIPILNFTDLFVKPLFYRIKYKSQTKHDFNFLCSFLLLGFC